MTQVSLADIEFTELEIGRGFSNAIKLAKFRGKDVAVKISDFSNDRIKNEYFREKAIYKSVPCLI